MYIAIDTETSGLNPFKHRLLSVAIHLMSDKFELLDGEIFYIKDDVGDVDPKAMEINGIDLAWVEANGMSKEDVEILLEKRIKEAYSKHGKLTPVGQNIAFDLDKWLANKMIKLQPTLEMCLNYHRRDTGIIADFQKDRGELKIQSTSLKSLTTHYGIKHEAHNALTDCKAVLELYAKQVKKKSLWQKILDLFR